MTLPANPQNAVVVLRIIGHISRTDPIRTVWLHGGAVSEKLDTSKLMLTILAGVATWEREIMLERQREGIAKAKAAGIYKGLQPSIDQTKIRELLTQMGPAGAAKTMVSRDRLFTSWASTHDERCTDA